MKVVLDTNVIISAMLGGSSARLLLLLREEAFERVLSTPILDQYLVVLRRPRFKLPLFLGGAARTGAGVARGFCDTARADLCCRGRPVRQQVSRGSGRCGSGCRSERR